MYKTQQSVASKKTHTFKTVQKNVAKETLRQTSEREK